MADGSVSLDAGPGALAGRDKETRGATWSPVHVAVPSAAASSKAAPGPLAGEEDEEDDGEYYSSTRPGGGVPSSSLALLSLDEDDEKEADATSESEFLAPQEAEVRAWRRSVYEAVTIDHPISLGKALSCREREEKGTRASTLVYGEINFNNFAVAFDKLKHRYGKLKAPGGVFYDIGSGTGKGVFAAALLHDFDACKGIEILSGLHSASVEMKDKWDRDVRATLPEAKRRTEISFIRGDATTYDWSDATVWFANSTCFDDTLMSKLAAIADRQAVGTLAITFTRRIPSLKWKVLEYQVYRMSWGNATVYLHEKTAE